MRIFTMFTIGAVALMAGGLSTMAETQPVVTGTAAETQIKSTDGTTTTVVVPEDAPADAVEPAKDTVVVVQPTVAIDAMTGKPIEEKAGTEEEETLRDRVRDQMKH